MNINKYRLAKQFLALALWMSYSIGFAGAQVSSVSKSLDQWAEKLKNDGMPIADRARIHGLQANEAIFRCGKYVDGWLAHSDPRTGLIPRNLRESKHYWNGRDCGADNYAFMVLTCALSDRKMFEGRMLDMLRTETKGNWMSKG